jgi:hypothetical protein
VAGDVGAIPAPQDTGQWRRTTVVGVVPIVEYEPGAAFPGVIGWTADKSSPEQDTHDARAGNAPIGSPGHAAAVPVRAGRSMRRHQASLDTSGNLSQTDQHRPRGKWYD